MDMSQSLMIILFQNLICLLTVNVGISVFHYLNAVFRIYAYFRQEYNSHLVLDVMAL